MGKESKEKASFSVSFKTSLFERTTEFLLL